jgi:hypothetical protein
MPVNQKVYIFEGLGASTYGLDSSSCGVGGTNQKHVNLAVTEVNKALTPAKGFSS